MTGGPRCTAVPALNPGRSTTFTASLRVCPGSRGSCFLVFPGGRGGRHATTVVIASTRWRSQFGVCLRLCVLGCAGQISVRPRSGLEKKASSSLSDRWRRVVVQQQPTCETFAECTTPPRERTAIGRSIQPSGDFNDENGIGSV